MSPSKEAARAMKCLRDLADETRAEHARRYFKTGKGEYGEGDRFLGLRVPVVRKQVKLFRDMKLEDIEAIVRSPYHEIRLFALLFLVYRFEKKNSQEQDQIYTMYMDNRSYVNNWDLVDSSAPKIVGGYLLQRDRSVLYELIKSNVIWDRRIAVMACAQFIRHRDFSDIMRIAEILLLDSHDLMHKAIGWMLREVGKRDQACEERFLERHAAIMPRTMLRYAIERFEPEKRKYYLGLGRLPINLR